MDFTNGDLISTIAAALLAFLGWAVGYIHSSAVSSARLKRALDDISRLESKVADCVPKSYLKDSLDDVVEDIRDIKASLKEMDRRRDSARGEVSDFRERISGEIGEIRAALSKSYRSDPRE